MIENAVMSQPIPNGSLILRERQWMVEFRSLCVLAIFFCGCNQPNLSTMTVQRYRKKRDEKDLKRQKRRKKTKKTKKMKRDKGNKRDEEDKRDEGEDKLIVLYFNFAAQFVCIATVSLAH